MRALVPELASVEGRGESGMDQDAIQNGPWAEEQMIQKAKKEEEQEVGGKVTKKRWRRRKIWFRRKQHRDMTPSATGEILF